MNAENAAPDGHVNRNPIPSGRVFAIFIFTILIAVALLFAPKAGAADQSWTGTTSTTWSTPTNWSGGVPGSTDNAVFNTTFANQPNVTTSTAVGGLWMTTGVGQNVTVSASASQVLILN